MASFNRERGFVAHLIGYLSMTGDLSNPNAAGPETGIDVDLFLSSGEKIGVQVTEIDPHSERGVARAIENRMAQAQPDKPYFMWAQNDPAVITEALGNAVGRKVKIAARHSLERYDEIWLLIVGSIPEGGSVGATFLMTPWLSTETMNSATGEVLRQSKFDRCWLMSIAEQSSTLFEWTANTGWKKQPN